MSTEPVGPTDDDKAPHLFNAGVSLEAECKKALSGVPIAEGVNKETLVPFCKIIDYWLADDTVGLIDNVGLLPLAEEIKKDYVLASFLAWRGEYKLASIALRSFLESFCLLLYYLNQGCDRLLYLRGKGYKLMLHRMAQKHGDVDEMHAFRRHYHLLIEDGYGNEKAANKFFEEINACYSSLSKAVHGEYSPPDGVSQQSHFIELLQRVLRICNTLALHDPMFDATEDDLGAELKGLMTPICFEWRPS